MLLYWIKVQTSRYGFFEQLNDFIIEKEKKVSKFQLIHLSMKFLKMLIHIIKNNLELSQN